MELPSKAPLMIGQHWFRQWFGAGRQQAITFADVDPDLSPYHGVTRPRGVDLWRDTFIFGKIKYINIFFHYLKHSDGRDTPCNHTSCVMYSQYCDCWWPVDVGGAEHQQPWNWASHPECFGFSTRQRDLLHIELLWRNIRPFSTIKRQHRESRWPIANTYFTLLITWLLMTWRRKEPGHQQPWYILISSIKICRSSDRHIFITRTPILTGCHFYIDFILKMPKDSKLIQYAIYIYI